MEQYFLNENTCDIFMNEIRMEDELLLELQENGSIQTKRNRNPDINEEKMKDNLKKLHAQRSFWRTNNINVLCLAF
jgi:hypothetical protein